MEPKIMVWLAIMMVLGFYTQLTIMGYVPELPIVNFLLFAVGYVGFIVLVLWESFKSKKH